MKLPKPLQVGRRSVQLAVIALTVLIPVAARYANYLSARQLDDAIERFDGSVQGHSLALVDGALRLATGAESGDVELRGDEREAVILAARNVRGSTWSLELFGLTLTDPLAALESAFASRTARRVMFVGILIPLLGTILLGRVFCSWICPAGFLLEITGFLRRVLRFLELRPGRVRLWHGNKYLLLGLGLGLSAVVGLPILGYVYPPALVGREVHNGITVMFDRAEDGLVGFSAAGLTVTSWFLLAIVLVEVAFGSRIWCRSLCPGGGLFTALGAFRLVRVKRDDKSCTQCGECVVACEMGLSPMLDRTGVECDNCGKCVANCSDDALAFRMVGSERRARKEAVR